MLVLVDLLEGTGRVTCSDETVDTGQGSKWTEPLVGGTQSSAGGTHTVSLGGSSMSRTKNIGLDDSCTCLKGNMCSWKVTCLLTKKKNGHVDQIGYNLSMWKNIP